MVKTLKMRWMIVLSGLIQLALGVFTAHPYDGRVFLAVGYSVAHGNSPYEWADVSSVFGNTVFPNPVSGIGYPPPWGLILALSYLTSYGLFPNLIFYNLVMKVPVVISNVLLALLIGRIVLLQTSDAGLSERSIKFMLFNPYVIYTTAVWGQFDTLPTLMMLLAVIELAQDRRWHSAIALGTSVALKLIPIVLLPLAVMYEKKNGGVLTRYSIFFVWW